MKHRYRIIMNSETSFRIEQRCWFFWQDIAHIYAKEELKENKRGNGLYVSLTFPIFEFKSLDEAQTYLDNLEGKTYLPDMMDIPRRKRVIEYRKI
jgi:hypothetical protein